MAVGCAVVRSFEQSDPSSSVTSAKGSNAGSALRAGPGRGLAGCPTQVVASWSTCLVSASAGGPAASIRRAFARIDQACIVAPGNGDVLFSITPAYAQPGV